MNAFDLIIALDLDLDLITARCEFDIDEFSKYGSGSLLSHADRVETRRPINAIPLVLVPDRYGHNSKPSFVNLIYNGPEPRTVPLNAFLLSTSLEGVNLSGCENLTSIEKGAFYECKFLKTVDLSKCAKLTSIGAGVFYHCTSLETMNLSGCANLTSIGEKAFYGCSKLQNLDLMMCSEEKLMSIGDGGLHELHESREDEAEGI